MEWEPTIGIYLLANILTFWSVFVVHAVFVLPSNASRCRFNAREPANGSTRDVVVFYASSVKRGFILTVKSLHSTGSRCRIVAFAPRSLR
jgi:hypothetical protein